MATATKFFSHVNTLLDQRGRKYGNLNFPAYHLKGIGVKADRARAGRTDLDNAADGAAYFFLHWYTAGRHK
jgi:hypothetical protein